MQYSDTCEYYEGYVARPLSKLSLRALSTDSFVG